MSRNQHTPDKWVILKFKGKDSTFFKVLGSWYGGYLGSDSWRLSSGLERVEEDGDTLLMHNFSGSIYKVNKNTDGMSMLATDIYNQAKAQGEANGVEVSIVTLEEFNNENKTSLR
jgi:hypothetical protein